MEFISLLALILLTLAGYSSGYVLATPGRKAVPAVPDLLVTFALWAAALTARPALGRGWGILFGFGLGLLFGLLLGAVRRRQFAAEKQASRGWQGFNLRLGEFQSRIFLTWFYFIFVTPFGFITRLTSDRLQLRPPQTSSLWLERPPAKKPDAARARRQF